MTPGQRQKLMDLLIDYDARDPDVLLGKIDRLLKVDDLRAEVKRLRAEIRYLVRG